MSGTTKGLILCCYGLLAGLTFISPVSGEWNCSLRVHFIDVGYGDAILVELPDATTMLLDSGDAGDSSRLLAYLKARRVRRIDTAVITHPHQNHFGGISKLVGRIPVGRVFHNGDPGAEEGYPALLTYLGRGHIPVEILRRGRDLEQLPDGVTITILNPPDLDGGPNDNSIALWLRHGKVSFLFPGDIGPDRQDALLAAFPGIRQADCVQVPHHGGPLSDTFIQAFQRKLFIVSTGPNRWGLPSEDQLKRLNGTVYRTDKNGTIIVESDGAFLKVAPWPKNGN